MLWGVLDKLLHLNLNIRVCCEQLGVHLFWGVFCTYGPPYKIALNQLFFVYVHANNVDTANRVNRCLYQITCVLDTFIA